MAKSADRFLENDGPEISGTGLKYLLAAATLAADWVGRPLGEKARSLAVSADQTLVQLFEKNGAVPELARSRATRAEIFGVGFVAGALAGRNFPSRVIIGTITGFAAVASNEVASDLPPIMK